MKEYRNGMGLLFLVFLTLKLTEIIDWSWWFITMPLYGGASIILIFALGVACWAKWYHVRMKRKDPEKYEALKKRTEKPKRLSFQERLEEAQKRRT